MNAHLHNTVSNQDGNAGKVTEALRSSLDKKYGQMLHAARNVWERNFAGKDPSDACVSVRITSAAGRPLSPNFRGALRLPVASRAA